MIHSDDVSPEARVKILEDQVARLEEKVEYYEILTNWYREARDRAVQHADETIKKFSWGI